MEFHWLEISPMVFSTSDDAVTDEVLFKVLTNVFAYHKKFQMIVETILTTVTVVASLVTS